MNIRVMHIKVGASWANISRHKTGRNALVEYELDTTQGYLVLLDVNLRDDLTQLIGGPSSY
jgi:hypothetical protein